MALGSAYYRIGDLEGAEREYLEAVKVDPAFGEAHSNLAVLYLTTGRAGRPTGRSSGREIGFQGEPAVER